MNSIENKKFGYSPRLTEPYVFPIAISSNMFSISALLVLLGIIGKVNFAADVGLVQAATTAIFLAFAANARNLILRDRKGTLVQQLTKFRLSMLPVLALLSYLLSVGIVDVKGTIVTVIIGRRCAEWLAELHLSESERIGDLKVGYRFIILQAGSFFVLVTAIFLEYSAMVTAGLIFWAISPITLSCQFVARTILNSKIELKSVWKVIFSHLGSSWVVGLTTYLFRLLLVLLVGKPISGMLFSAYAAGGMINSIYTYALGPSIIVRQRDKAREEHSNKKTYISVAIIAAIGLGIVYWLDAITIQLVDSGNRSFYWYILGISMIGSSIMILAQQTRLKLLQVFQSDDVVVPDILANILIVASVPFAYYLFDYSALPYLFLWNALLNWLFYNLASISLPYGCGFEFTNPAQDNTIIRWLKLNREKIQTCILFLICVPLFLQLNGSIFNAKDMIYDSQGSLFLVPLPISVLACYLGLSLTLRYDAAKLSAVFVFSFFLMMVSSTFIIGGAEGQTRLDKMIFLIQFTLPVFGIVLGQSYQKPPQSYLRMEVIFFSVVAIIVPVQLIASWHQKYMILSPYVYFFSIYQHLQYVPVIIISLYFLSLPGLFEYHIGRISVFLISPFIGIYTAASMSMLAIFFAASSSVLITFALRKEGFRTSVIVVTAMVIVPMLVYAYMIRINPAFKAKLLNFKQKEASSGSTLPNVSERMHYWKYYLNGTFDSPKKMLLGHVKRPDRNKFPSAHNYYLDLVYNFGLISVLPFLLLIIYTTIKIINRMRDGPLQPELVILSLVVFFFIFIDNSLKVGFRQPYPGIIMFFLWGVLLSKLTSKSSQLKIKDTVTE